MNASVRSSAAVALFAASGIVHAQTSAPRDSLRLSALHALAVSSDPRLAQLRLQSSITDLKLRNITAEQRPALAVNGMAQYQSAVTSFTPTLPKGTPVQVLNFPTPPHDTYDAHVEARQSIYDPTIGPRRAAERAQLVENQADVRAMIYATRAEVDDAFFTALQQQERAAQIDASMQELDAQLQQAVVQLSQGAALPGDTAAIAASLLQDRQTLEQTRADRHAALARLSDLVGRSILDSTVLELPNARAAVAAAARSADEQRARPEYAQFAASRASLESQEAVDVAQDKPHVSAFLRSGIGRPGLNMVSSNFESYWLGGVQVEWTPWTWGTVDRNREVLEVQRQIVATNEAAFARSLQQAVQSPLATIARLDTTLALDERIVALREEVDRETGAKLREGVITTSEYVDRNTDLLNARLARAQHRVELAQARANLLTTLGVEVP